MSEPIDELDIGYALVALGRDLYVPDVDLVESVRSDIEGPIALRRWNQRTTMLAAAATIVLVVLMAVLAITPAREAVADWLGIGRTSVEVVDTLPPASPPVRPATSTPALTTPSEPAPVIGETYADLRAHAQPSLTFEIRLPDSTEIGPIQAWELRPTGETTELVVFWDEISLAQRPDSEESLRNSKFVLSAEAVIATSVDGATEALWIEGEHVRIGESSTDLSQSVLLWVIEGVEYRLEGDISLDRARVLAASMN